jgi:hypothetical protein
MFDLFCLAVTLAFFIVGAALTRGCEKLEGEE